MLRLQRRVAERGLASSAGSAEQEPGIVWSPPRTPGAPLDVSTRAFFESRFNRDLGAVRVYTGAEAASAARTLDALAFTTGSKISFDRGRYEPGTTKGMKLIAHELAHVVQFQNGDGALDVPATSHLPSVAGARAEREAEIVSESMAAPRPIAVPTLALRAGTIAPQKKEPATKEPATSNQSATQPSYSVDDLIRRLALLNEGTARGGDVVRLLQDRGWHVFFWDKGGKTEEEGKRILLPKGDSLDANTVTLFHEAMHALHPTRPVVGSTGSATDPEVWWLNVEDELQAQYYEVLFLRANAEAAPSLATASTWAEDWPRIRDMSEEELEAYFRDEAVADTVIAKVLKSGPPPAGTFGPGADLDLTQISSTPRVRGMLDRIFRRVRPRPTISPPPRERPRFD